MDGGGAADDADAWLHDDVDAKTTGGGFPGTGLPVGLMRVMSADVTVAPGPHEYHVRGRLPAGDEMRRLRQLQPRRRRGRESEQYVVRHDAREPRVHGESSAHEQRGLDAVSTLGSCAARAATAGGRRPARALSLGPSACPMSLARSPT